jgi:hypothetical protein
VDGAYNIGKLGISTPPVFAPLSALPVAPVIRSVVAPESGKITVTWSTSRETGIKEYRVYRTDQSSLARDVARMSLVKVEPEPDAPASRPQTRDFPDSGLTGARTYFYRVVTVSNSGAVSEPSPAVSARAFDEALPTVPTPTLAWVEVNNVTLAELTWQSEFETLLEERPAGAGSFIQLGTWRPAGSIKVRDPFSDPTQDFEYRLSARKDTGAIAQGLVKKLDKRG